MTEGLKKWADAPAGKKAPRPSKKAVAAADSASDRASSASSYANSLRGNNPVSHMRAYIGTTTGSKQVGQRTASHVTAANAHLAAAKAQAAVGNHAKAQEHLARASEHAKDSGEGTNVWSEDQHPRDEQGRFT